MLTIHQLRKEFGWKVRVNHYRLDIGSTNECAIKWFRDKNQQSYISPTGGRTLIEITDRGGNNYKFEAKCSPKDSFNRKTALKICLGRLEKQLEQIKELERK